LNFDEHLHGIGIRTFEPIFRKLWQKQKTKKQHTHFQNNFLKEDTEMALIGDLQEDERETEKSSKQLFPSSIPSKRVVRKNKQKINIPEISNRIHGPWHLPHIWLPLRSAKCPEHN
jgi:hypothetical protein